MTSAMNTSSIRGNSGGMTLNPSAAPSLNQSSIRSATCSGVPAIREMAARAGHVAQELPQRRLVAADDVDDDFGAAARRLDRLRGRGNPPGQRLVERQMREIMPAEAARQALAPDLGIGQLVELARKALGLGLGRADHRGEAGQDQHLVRARPSAAASAFRSA